MKTKKHKGDLIVTIENQNNFKDLTEVSGSIYVRSNATLTAPKLEKSGYIDVSENATLTAPKLEKSGSIDVRSNATLTAPKLEKSGYIDVSENATLTAPKLEKSGSIDVRSNATLTAPKLEKSGYIDVRSNATLTAPKLVEVSGSIDVRSNATLTAPKLEKSGYIDVRSNATLTAPKLVEVSGYIDVRSNATLTAPKLEKSGSIYVSENATLTAPKLTIKNNIAKLNRKEYKVIHNDGVMFFVEKERSSKGIKIYSGLMSVSLKNKETVSVKAYLVEKGGFSSHGESLKKAISDLQFKVVAEKLKNEPINEDTELTVNYYRTITGACDIGCKDFMDKNNIPYVIENDKVKELNSIKAKDLLPILEKNNAYGVDRFKQLITF